MQKIGGEKQVMKYKKKICPKCGREYAEAPALSREDHETLICPECGTREALESIGMDVEMQEEILAAIYGTEKE